MSFLTSNTYLNFQMSPSSPLGLFARRCILEMSRISYESNLKLFEFMKTYIQGGAAQADAFVDLERFVDMTVRDLQGASFTRLRIIEPCLMTQTPKELCATLTEIQISKPEWSKVYFAQYVLDRADRDRYLNHVRCHEFESALESLQRFFDLSHDGLYVELILTPRNMPSTQAYQYSLIHLTSLYTHFGKYEEAFRIVQQAIPLARESKDDQCLQYLQR